MYSSRFLLTNSSTIPSRSRQRAAFSLVELMVVIVIIGLLASVVTISMQGYLTSSKQNIAKMEISKMVTALDTFYTQYDRYPTTSEGIRVLVDPSEKFPEGLLSKLPKDPWNVEYEYFSPAANAPYEIICFGRDHKEGGTGADRDISSLELVAK